MLKLYWSKFQERKAQEIKLQASFAGIDLEEKTKEQKLAEAKAKAEDPLKDFPYDMSYLTEADCNAKIRITNDPKLNFPAEQKWDDYRKNCCLGKFGIEAKRCSMNDVLWKRYVQAIQVGRPLNLDTIKNMVMFDMARSELYPKNYKGSPDAPPPENYINELKASGKYMEIIQRLDTISKRIIQDGKSQS